jgi:hypothetical protein
VEQKEADFYKLGRQEVESHRRAIEAYRLAGDAAYYDTRLTDNPGGVHSRLAVHAEAPHSL